MATTGGALHSDHVNYLIFRYLQEAGHANAASGLWKDWNRPREFRDPELLPFAPAVRRHELISVIQDGLLHDEMQARVTRNDRRFRWTDVNARDSVERNEQAFLQNGEGAASRPTSSGKRKSRVPPPAMRAPDEFPTPTPKRQRVSQGSEVHVNGDREAMDVDAASPSADADAEGEDDEVPSPAVASEGAVEVVERYDSMDVATQTDVKTAPKTSTMYWKLDKPGATILHSMWNPDSDPKNVKTLLTVGESLCRFYRVPDSMDELKQITHIDEPSIPPSSVITATAWHPDGRTVTCAVGSVRHLPNGRQEPGQTIIDIGRDIGTVYYGQEPQLLEPAGVVLCLRYSPDGKYLLAASTDLKRGAVQIWSTARDSPALGHVEKPIAWRIFEGQVFDAVWTDGQTFAIGGESGLSSSHRVQKSDLDDDHWTASYRCGDYSMIQLTSGFAFADVKWDKLRFDKANKLVVFASTESSRMVAHAPAYDVPGQEHPDIVVDLPGRLTALAFHPRSAARVETEFVDAGDRHSLLAAAFEEGFCVLYAVSKTDEVAKVEELTTLNLPAGPALAISWSPDGRHLAVGGTDLVSIWHSEADSNAIDRQPLVTWRPDAGALGTVNGTVNGVHTDGPLSEPSLSWSADGESLCFALDKQIAVIRFRPPLHSSEQPAETNGNASP